MVINDAKAILIILLEIRIVEKNVCGLLIKYCAYLAAKLFFRARNSTFNLFETMYANSDEEKKPLNNNNPVNPIISSVIYFNVPLQP